MTETCPALILAGGGGTRLGGVDKAFLPLNGQPLIAHLLHRLIPQTRQIAISANGDPARFAAFNLPVLPDGALTGKGPLAGVAAGLAWAQSIGAAELLTIPVDTPFFPENLVECLTPAPAVAVWRGRQHHLVAIWQVTALPQLLAFLTQPGAYKVRDALFVSAARQVAFDAETDPFLNINTPEDLAAAALIESPQQSRLLNPL
jgi:molybdopterin-guanine dinucleotide biosynthesis protein A